MDSYFLKLQGKAELPKRIEIGSNFRVLLEGSITGEEITDNDDGSLDHAFKFKPVIVEAITKTGETIKAKDTRSRGQQYRFAIRKTWEKIQDPRSFEEYYDARMLEKIKEEIDSNY